MPELPEVETIRLSLSKNIIGLAINKIEVLNKKSFIGDTKDLTNKKVLRLWRRAKNLGIELTGEITLLIHLKMSGQLIFIQEKNERFIGGHPTKDMFGDLPNSHTRVIFEFDNNSKLFFNDQRKFGWIKIIETSKLEEESFFQKVGPEPLEGKFSWQNLKDNLKKHPKTPIKVAILDQTVVAGVGNIYACEGLFNAGINPQIKVQDLSDQQFKKIHQGIIKALQNGILYGGSTKTHFTDSDGKKGLFLDHAAVYNREGKLCQICQEKILKIKLAGRGTFLCPKCQK